MQECTQGGSVGTGSPTAHGLTHYADSRPIIVHSYTCWYFDHIGPGLYRQQDLGVEATGPRQALTQCLEHYSHDQRRDNRLVQRT